MARRARLGICLLVGTGLAFAARPPPAQGLPSAQHPWCRGVDCSGHGVCMVEGTRPFCFCEDGYAAEQQACVPAREPEGMWRVRRSPAVAERVVSVASAYRDDDWRGVGADLRRTPYGLRHYMFAGEQWCTEFVSWSYLAGGAPLTGGSEGGWMIRNNRALREWFVRHDLWVERSGEAWASFVPRAGDYVRFHTRSGAGHSGIVRYVDGDTLYTVEGNVGNRVRLRRFRSFREDERIDGIGMFLLPDARARHAR